MPLLLVLAPLSPPLCLSPSTSNPLSLYFYPHLSHTPALSFSLSLSLSLSLSASSNTRIHQSPNASLRKSLTSNTMIGSCSVDTSLVAMANMSAQSTLINISAVVAITRIPGLTLTPERLRLPHTLCMWMTRSATVMAVTGIRCGTVNWNTAVWAVEVSTLWRGVAGDSCFLAVSVAGVVQTLPAVGREDALLVRKTLL